jgi:hypothetical protein
MPEELLEELYRRIQTNEIKMSDGDMYESEVVTFMAPTRSGWLSKQGAGSRLAKTKWNKHWFLVSDSCLYYFLNQQDDDPRCIIPLENCGVRKVPNNRRMFSLYSTVPKGLVKSVKVMDNGAMKQGGHSEFKLRAESEEERDAWIASIEQELSKHEFHDMLKLKKDQVQERASNLAHQDKPVLEGWMYKKGAINTGWRKRYCTIQASAPSRLYYFDSEQAAHQMKNAGNSSAKGFVELATVVSVKLVEDKSAPKFTNNQCIELRTVKPTRQWCFAPVDVTLNSAWINDLKAVANIVETADGASASTSPDSTGANDDGQQVEEKRSQIVKATSVDEHTNSF